MTNAHSFPLLRLPNLAREHVVLVMDIREQYLFATLSKKSKRLVKNGLRRMSYILNIVMRSDKIYIEIKKNGTDHRFEIKIVPTHDVVSDSSYQICLKVEDVRESIMGLFPFLEGLFNISKFDLRTCYLPNDFTKQVLATVKSLKISIYELEVELDTDNEMFAWVMENCRDVRRLRNWISPTEDFQWDSQEPFNSEFLSLWNAPRLTLDHMTRLFMDCKFFQVARYYFQFTYDDLNQFVKVWMNDCKMEYFEILISQSDNLSRILKDIEKVPVRRAFLENSLETFAPRKAFKIRQKCGKEAVVCILYDQFMINAHFDNRHCDFWVDYDDDEKLGGVELEDVDLEDEDFQEEDEHDEDLEDGDMEEEDEEEVN